MHGRILYVAVGLCAVFAVRCGSAPPASSSSPDSERRIAIQRADPGERSEVVRDRHALVVGNANYESGGELANPVRDARAMHETLSDLDFESELVLDTSRLELRDAVLELADRVDSDDVALFYYAGHGLEVDGVNYLLPVEFDADDERKTQDEAIELDRLMRALSGRDGITIVILDACRNDPFSRSWSRSTRGRGFARVETVPTGTYLAFSTAPGEIALDGDDTNSPFTSALVTELREHPDQEIDRVFRNVRGAVQRATGERQRPWTNHDLVDEFYFAAPVAEATQDDVTSDAEPSAEAVHPRQRRCEPTATDRCPTDHRAWCDDEGTQLACCAEGLVASAAGDGICVCAPGGAPAPVARTTGCPAGNPDRMQEVIGAAMEPIMEEIRTCFDELADTTAFEGRVSLDFALDPEGRVVNLRLGMSTIADGRLQKCVLDIVRAQSFPAPVTGWAEVSYPVGLARSE